MSACKQWIGLNPRTQSCCWDEMVIETVEHNPEHCELTGRRLTVAFVVHNFSVGGLERCIARLANALDRQRFRPMIICLDKNGTAAQWLDRDDISVIELHKKPGNDLGVVRRLARTLRDMSVDIVHSHNWGTLVETTLARKLSGTATHIHAERGMELDAMNSSSWKRKLRGRATRWALERSDCVVAVAEAVRRQVLQRCGRLSQEILVIPNGVSRPEIDPQGPTVEEIRQQFSIPSDAVVIGSVGRLVPVKDFGLAIDAVARLAGNGRNVHLMLVGDGSELPRLTAHAAASGVADNIHLVGHREDVGNWLAAMDVYVNCSLNEGMSQSVLEAMSTGLPLVVTDVGDSGLLVGGEDSVGRVVPSGDVEAFAAALDELITDNQLRRELGQRSVLRHQECYSLDGMIERYEALYETLSGAQSCVGDSIQTTEPVT